MQKKIVKKALSYLLTAVIIMGSINLSPLGMVEAKADTNASITIGGVTINLNSHDAPKYALVTGDTVTIVEAPGDAYNIKIEYVGGWPDSYYKVTLKDMNYTGATTSVDDKEVAMYISIPWVEGIVDIVESNSICGSVENESIGMYIDVQDKCTFTGSGTLTVGDNTGNYATGLYVAQASMTSMEQPTLSFTGNSYGIQTVHGSLSIGGSVVTAKGLCGA